MNDPRDMTDAELRAELQERLRGRSSSVWLRIHYAGRTIHSAVFRADGSASAAGEPERIALEAIAMAHRRQAERRSDSAKRSAITRAKRHALGVQAIVAALLADKALPPAARCRLCGRGLEDADSRARGIGPECWQGVLSALERAQQSKRGRA